MSSIRRVTAPLAAAALLLSVALAGTSSSRASAAAIESLPARLAYAQAIRAQVHARLRRLPGVGLAITEARSTNVIESFALLSEDLLETRFVPAERGIWYSICPAGAPCISPALRVARPAANHLPRRLALELALRTFLETDATVVAVSLPTPRHVAFVVEREELAREVAMPALSRSLRSEPVLASPAWLRRSVDELTRPRTFRFIGFEPAANGGTSWGGMPRWPTLRS